MEALTDSLTRKYIVTGFFIGIASGLLGVGGGIFLVPILTSLFQMEQKAAQAVSLAVVLPTAVVGVLIYGLYGNIDYLLAAKLAVGAVVGAAAGARLMKKLPSASLKRLFGILLVAVGMRMLLS
jgi:uncharacterized membrane protein YfcA